MTVQRHDRQNLYVFHFNNWSDALVATFIAVKASEQAKQHHA